MLVIAAILGAAGWLVARWFQPVTPWVDGQPVEVWIERAVAESSLNSEAAEKVMAMGELAAPGLGKVVVSPESYGGRARRWLAFHIPAPVAKWLPGPPVDPMRRKVGALQLLGALRTNAFPALPAIEVALKDPHEIVRGHAALVLGNLGTNAGTAATGLLELASETNSFVLGCALPSIGRLRLQSDIAVPRLARQVSHSRPEVRLAALIALMQYGPSASNAVPALVSALLDPDPSVRNSALMAAARIRDSSPAMLDGLNQALAEPDHEVQLLAIQALSAIGPQARGSVPRIVEAMRNNVGGLWRYGRVALLNIAPETPEASEALLDQ